MPADPDRLQGAWRIVSIEMEGNTMGGGGSQIEIRGQRFPTSAGRDRLPAPSASMLSRVLPISPPAKATARPLPSGSRPKSNPATRCVPLRASPHVKKV